jgi:hypothetical protein
MLNLQEHLTGARYVPVDKIERRTHWQASGIIENKPDWDTRTNEKIYEQTFNSMACEIGIADALPAGELNETTFNHKDRSTYAWDVKQHSTKFEIKWMSLESAWWSFNVGLVDKVIRNFNAGYPDYIIVGTNIKHDDQEGYAVFPRFLINPASFREYVTKSKYDNYKSHYYNHRMAEYDGECQVYNKGIIKEMKKNENSPLQYA